MVLKVDDTICYFRWDDVFEDLDIISDIKNTDAKHVIFFSQYETQMFKDFYKWGFNFINLIEFAKDNSVKLTVVCNLPLEHYRRYPETLKNPYNMMNLVSWPTFFLNFSLLNIKKQDYHSYSSIDRPFISLNRHPHLHRRKMMDELSRSNLIDKGYVSWLDYQINWSINVNYEYQHWKPEKLSLTEPNIPFTQWAVPEEFFKSFFSLVCETSIHFPFITEKTWNCLLLEKPFIILSSQGVHRYLESMGFELYDEFIDYSFDEEPGGVSNLRYKLIAENLHRLTKIKNYDKARNSIIDKIKRNKKRALELAFDTTLIPQEVMDIYPKIKKMHLLDMSKKEEYIKNVSIG